MQIEKAELQTIKNVVVGSTTVFIIAGNINLKAQFNLTRNYLLCQDRSVVEEYKEKNDGK